MDSEKLLKECCTVAFTKPSGEIEELNKLTEVLQEIIDLIPEDIFLKLDNLIGLYSARSLEDGYIQGFKDGSNLMMYIKSND